MKLYTVQERDRFCLLAAAVFLSFGLIAGLAYGRHEGDIAARAIMQRDAAKAGAATYRPHPEDGSAEFVWRTCK